MKKIKILVFIISILLLTSCGLEMPINNRVEKEFEDPIKVKMEIKNYGTIELEVYPNLAPITVDNFITLVKNGTYDGTTFHRVIKDLMIQGGDPTGTGYGGTNKTIKGEFSANGVENILKHERGVISMAIVGNDYNSASSQFFIVQKTNSSLDGRYAAFGRVTSGIEIVDSICNNTKVEDSNGTVLKENQPVITRIYVVEGE